MHVWGVIISEAGNYNYCYDVVEDYVFPKTTLDLSKAIVIIIVTVINYQLGSVHIKCIRIIINTDIVIECIGA